MKSSARLKKACLLAPILVMVLGCGQFQGTSVSDPCPEEKGLDAVAARSCSSKRNTEVDLRPEERQLEIVPGLEGEALPIAGRRLRQVIAMDYSGSMYGGYSNESPTPPPCGWSLENGRRVKNGPYYWEQEGFAQFLSGGPLGALTNQDVVFPMVFNHSVTVLASDGVHSTFDPGLAQFSTPLPPAHQGRDQALTAITSVNGGRLPPNPAEAGFGDPTETHLNEVLAATEQLFESFESRDGVLWIITDNIIEQEEGGAVARSENYNGQFYHGIQNNPRWQVVQAWPIHQADWLCGSTLMVYGLYYSSRARIDEEAYYQLTQGEDAQIAHSAQMVVFQQYSNPSSPAPGRPFKLKPSDIDVVKVTFLGNVMCEAAKVGRSSRCRAKIRLENRLHHRQILSAKITLVNGRCDPWSTSPSQVQPFRFAAPFCGGTIRGDVPLSDPLGPHQERKPEIELQVPAIEVHPKTFIDHWNSASVSRFRMIGRMNVEIDDVITEMVIPEESLRNIYGVEQLPEIFRNESQDKLKPTKICLPIEVENPSNLGSFVIVILVLLPLPVILVYGFLRPSFRTVVINGAPLGLFRLVRFSSKELEFQSKRIGSIRLAWSLWQVPVLRAAPGHKIYRRGSHWIHVDETEGTENQIEVISRATPRPPRGDDGF